MRDPNATKAAWRSQRSRMNVLRGDAAQDVVGMRLCHFGLELVERIETGFRVQRVLGRIVGARPMAKVAADWTAIVPGGRSVRCEVKARRDDQLSLSDFAPHQLWNLTRHADLGGISLVGWLTTRRLWLLGWPIAGLVSGKPLNDGDARTLAAEWKGLADGR